MGITDDGRTLFVKDFDLEEHVGSIIAPLLDGVPKADITAEFRIFADGLLPGMFFDENAS